MRKQRLDGLQAVRKKEDAKVLAKHDGVAWERYDIHKAQPPAPPKDRPEAINRGEAKRQRTLQERREKSEPAPPTRKLDWLEYKYIEPSRVWETCDVPVSVLLIRNHYADGDTLDWALGSTKVFENPLEMWTTYLPVPARQTGLYPVEGVE